MTQQIAYEIIEKLSGTYEIPSRPVHIKDINELCRREYPGVYEDHYLSTSLGRLRHWKIISYNYRKREYTIINELPEPNICSTPITEEDIISE